MSNSSVPPEIPGHRDVIQLADRRRERENGSGDEGERQRRREDIHGQLANVVTLKKPEIAMRRKPAKAKPHLRGLAKTELREPVTPDNVPKIPSITGGKRGEVGTGALEHAQTMAEMTGSVRVDRIAPTMDLTLEPLDRDHAVKELQKFSEALAMDSHSHDPKDSEEIFFQNVARTLISIWPHNHRRHVNDRRVEDIVRTLKEEPLPARLKSMLGNYDKTPVGNRGNPRPGNRTPQPKK